MLKRVLILLTVLLTRFFFVWQGRWEIGQKVNFDLCLSTEPIYTQNGRFLSYRHGFQTVKIRSLENKKYNVGDCLRVTGKIAACENLSSRDLRMLKPVIFFQKDLSIAQKVKVVILRKMLNFRDKLTKNIHQMLPYPEADLLAGIVLGVKQELSEDLFRVFQRTGTLHIIVASGYNLVMVARKPFNFLPFFWGNSLSLIICLFLTWFYVGIVGFQPPIIRAGVMVSLFFLLKLSGWKTSSWWLVVLTAWLILFIDPGILFSVSFQLSFAALIGIVFGEEVFRGLTRIPVVGKDLAETLSAQLMVTPLILFYFGRVSVLAPITNLLVLPLVPWLTGFGLAALGFVWWPFFSKVVGWVLIYPFLKWVVVVIHWFSKISFIEKSINITWWQMVLMYVFIFLGIRMRKK